MCNTLRKGVTALSELLRPEEWTDISNNNEDTIALRVVNISNAGVHAFLRFQRSGSLL